MSVSIEDRARIRRSAEHILEALETPIASQGNSSCVKVVYRDATLEILAGAFETIWEIALRSKRG